MKLFSFLICFFCLTAALFSQERIINYQSDIKVEASGDLLVKETIRVQAEGQQIKRGIYRTFPTSYDNKMGTRFDVGFDVVEVLKDGAPEPFFTKKQNNGVIVYIGDENQFLSTGIYTYTLLYKTTRQIGFFEEFDELYFNAIGGDWAFPIEKARVNIELPEGAEVLQSDVFSGTSGSTTCNCELTFEDNQIEITTTATLQPKEQLTFAVAWPKGFVKEPTAAEKWKYFFESNFHVFFSILAFIIVFIIYYYTWKKVGVDPPKGTIIPLFDPPANFSPADIAVLHKMKMSRRALSSSIVNLAVKGHIKIMYSNKKYSLEKISKNTSPLSTEEEAISTALFSKGNTLKLENKNHAVFSKAISNSTKAIKKKLNPTYFSFNYKHLLFGILASMVLSVLAFVLSPSAIIPLILFFLLFFMALIFTYLIKAPTRKGRAVMDEIEGFKMYLKVAEKDQLNAAHEPEITPQRFEALLPFAIAIGLENEWGKKFENALSKSMQQSTSYNPSWYVGATTGMAFSASRFSSDMGKSFSSAISSASAAPGSSSGSGGGGFSGGGGGGGGGGGW